MTTTSRPVDETGAPALLATAVDTVGEAFVAVSERRGGGLDSAALADLLARSQELVNTLHGIQVVAMAQLAATDEELLEDGTLVEVERPLGHVREDAQDLVAPALGCSSSLAGDRVLRAVRACTHLPGLVRLQGSGRVGDYPARIVTDATLMLTEEQCGQVLDRVEPALRVIPPARLRAKVAAAITAVAPEHPARELEATTEERSLRRTHDRPGGQTWTAVVPNGDADVVWAAIDAVAKVHRRQGTAETLDQARADALLDLARQSIDATLVLTLAVPAAAGPSPSATSSIVAPTRHVAASRALTFTPAPLVPSPCEAAPVAVTGLAGGTAVHVTASWLAGASDRWTVQRAEVRCDRATGALLGRPVAAGSGASDALPTSTSHDPPAALAAFIRSRDGRCRFTGCSISATFCDLDHVRPWPEGPTEADNLICLCRRHHRVKQRPGWRVRLRPDAVAEWTNPHGVVTTTAPIDHLDLDRRPATAPTEPTEPTAAAGPVRRAGTTAAHRSPHDAPAPAGCRVFGARSLRVGQPSVLEDALGELLRPAVRRRRQERLAAERHAAVVRASTKAAPAHPIDLSPPPF